MATKKKRPADIVAEPIPDLVIEADATTWTFEGEPVGWFDWHNETGGRITSENFDSLLSLSLRGEMDFLVDAVGEQTRYGIAVRLLRHQMRQDIGEDPLVEIAEARARQVAAKLVALTEEVEQLEQPDDDERESVPLG